MTSETIDNFTSLVTPGHLWLITLVVFIYVILMSLIFKYHWKKFSTNNLSIRLAESIYLITTVILMVLLILITFTLSNNL